MPTLAEKLQKPVLSAVVGEPGTQLFLAYIVHGFLAASQ